MPIYRIAATVEIELFVEHADEDEAIVGVEEMMDRKRASGLVPGSFRVESVEELEPEELPEDTKILTFLGESGEGL